jgi:alpha-methylacyl-CoA racemase
LAPDVLCALNPRLIFARLTGFRCDGTYGARAGHDVNYLAVSGVLSLLGEKEEGSALPTNILGGFADGGMVCALGILMALLYRGVSGRGQMVDANMVGEQHILLHSRKLQ